LSDDPAAASPSRACAFTAADAQRDACAALADRAHAAAQPLPVGDAAAFADAEVLAIVGDLALLDHPWWQQDGLAAWLAAAPGRRAAVWWPAAIDWTPAVPAGVVTCRDADALVRWAADGEAPAAELQPREPCPRYPNAAVRRQGERLRRLAADHAAPADAEAWAQARAARKRLQPGELWGDGRFRLLDRHGADAWHAWDLDARQPVLVEAGAGAWTDDEAAVAAWRAQVDADRDAPPPGHLPVLAAGIADEIGWIARPIPGPALSEGAGGALDATLAVAAVAAALARDPSGRPHGRIAPEHLWLSPVQGAALSHAWVPGPAPGPSLFAPPESLSGAWVPDARADVFGLGMTLLAALHVGALPFWVLREPERLLRTLDAPAGAITAIRLAIDWDPERRPPTAGAWLAHLLADDALAASLARVAEAQRLFALAAEITAHRLALADGSRRSALEAEQGRLLALSGDRAKAFDQLAQGLARADDAEPLLDALRALAADDASLAAPLREVLAAELQRRPAGARVELRIELAHRWSQGGEAERAEAEWEQVLREHQSPTQARIALGALAALCRARADWDGFVGYSRDLLPFLEEVDRPAVQHAIGAAYLTHLRDEQSALQWLDRAEAGGYTSADLARQLEEIRSRRGQWSQSIALLRRQADGAPAAEADALLARATHLAQVLEQGDGAIAEIRRARARHPEAPPVAFRSLAAVSRRLGRDDDAADALARLTEPTAGDWLRRAELVCARGALPDARTAVDAALACDPHHLLARRLLGRIALAQGDFDAAADAWAAVAAATDGVDHDPIQLEARDGLAECAWARGDLLAAAAGWLAVLEASPQHLDAAWGLARVALCARSNARAGATPAHLRALPARFTPSEAVARLWLGVVDADALATWADAWPTLRAVRAIDPDPVRLVCAAVDTLSRGGWIERELLRRFATAYPDWVRPIEAVEALWSGADVDGFPVPRAYRWSARWLVAAEADADAERPRTLATAGFSSTRLAPTPSGDDPWSGLVGGARPASPDAGGLPPDPPTELYVGSAKIPALVTGDGHLAAALVRAQDATAVADAPGVRLVRYGPFVYLESADAPAHCGERTGPVVRLVAGESVAVGLRQWSLRFVDREEELPAAAPPPDPAAAAAPTPPAPAGGPPPPSQDPLPPMLLDEDEDEDEDEPDGLTDPAVRGPIAPLKMPTPSVTPRPADPPTRADAVAPTLPDGGFDEVPAVPRRPSPAAASPVSAPAPMPGAPRPADARPPADTAQRLARPRTSGPDPLPAPAPVHRGAVEVMSGPERGFTRTVDGELTIGRGRESDIHIASDTQLSRIHCKVVERDGAYVLVDNASTRGTVVNGRKITEITLKGGEVIMAGRTVFSFRLVAGDFDRSDDATDVAGDGG
jgi:lipopolysaccharide biosynthesis regulator YciM